MGIRLSFLRQLQLCLQTQCTPSSWEIVKDSLEQLDIALSIFTLHPAILANYSPTHKRYGKKLATEQNRDTLQGAQALYTCRDDN